MRCEMDRKQLKSELIEALRKQKALLIREVAKASTEPDALTNVCLELTVVNCMLDSMESNPYNPFLDFHIQHDDGSTVYKVGDQEVDIIAADMDAFVFKAMSAMVARIPWCVSNTLCPNTINMEIISVIDRILHDKKMGSL